MNRIETSEGEFIELYSVGTKVRHKRYPELIGIIAHYEYHESGKISPLPYCVHWNNYQLAGEKLGWFFAYPSKDDVGEVN